MNFLGYRRYFRAEKERTAQQPQPREDIIAGRNAVLEALKAGTELEAVYLAKGDRQGSIVRIVSLCAQQKITLKEVSPAKLDGMCPGVAHQGVAAVLSAVSYSTVEDLFAVASQRGEPPFFLIADEIEDPHNLGAIIRTAEACGAHGLIIPKRRSAGLTSTVYKTSAGALSHLAVAKVPNLVAVIKELKERGVWVYAADMDGETWCKLDYTGPAAFVIGSEGRGVGRLVRETCDFFVSMPMCGKVNSLNASVAGSILMYEVLRQRQGIPAFSGKK